MLQQTVFAFSAIIITVLAFDLFEPHVLSDTVSIPLICDLTLKVRTVITAVTIHETFSPHYPAPFSSFRGM
jgi:hypothetical protein